MTDLLIRLREGSSHLAHDATMHEAAAEIERLRAALAAEQPEPVAWISEYGKDGYAGAARRVFLEDPSTMYPNSRITPLYASPPAQPDPLTDARIDERIDAAVAAERERIAAHFDARDKGVGGFYDAHEPAEIIRAMTQG